MFNEFERMPDARPLGLVMIILLEKATGGVWPIGLMPLMALVWSRIRRRWCAEWERRPDCRFFWGGGLAHSVR